MTIWWFVEQTGLEDSYFKLPVLAGCLSERTDLCEIICVCYEVLPRVEIKCPQDTLLSAVEQIKPAAHSPRKRIAAFESTNAKHKEAVRKCLMLDSNQSLSRRGCCVEGTKPMDHRLNRPSSASKMGVRARLAHDTENIPYSLDHTMMKTLVSGCPTLVLFRMFSAMVSGTTPIIMK
jgi:hypothetical protein